MPRKANPDTVKPTGINARKPKTVFVDYTDLDGNTMLSIRVDEDGTLSLHPISTNAINLTDDQKKDLRRRISQSLNG